MNKEMVRILTPETFSLPASAPSALSVVKIRIRAFAVSPGCLLPGCPLCAWTKSCWFEQW